MKLLENSKFTGAALLLLLALNTVLLGIFVLKKPCPPQGPPPMMPQGPPPPPGASARDFLIQQLQLNDAQQKQYDSLIKEHRALVDKFQSALRTTRDSMINLIGNSSADPASLSSRIGYDQSQIEKATFDHFRKLRAICNSSQQQKFDSVIKDALRMIAPAPPHPPGPRPGMPPPPPDAH